MKPYYETPLGKLYHGDCLEIMPHLEPVDLVLTDPPYGIGKRLVSGGKGHSFDSLILSGADEWDIKPSRKVFEQIFSISVGQIIWGGNFFDLPPCDCPIAWDKVRPNQRKVSEWEYGWTSLVGRARIFRYCANGGFITKTKREHPTQKPVALMSWCLTLFPNVVTVTDPFLGSGTTAVSCEKYGLNWIGIEIEEKYCEIAAKRIEQERKQLKLF